MRILVRADASAGLGTGHVMRCLQLARELVRGGADVVFASRTLLPELEKRIAGAGCGIVRLAGREPDAAESIAAMERAGGCDWVVVDSYELGEDWERAVAAAGPRVLAVDDLERRHACDIVVDQNVAPLPDDRYPGCPRRLLGPRYSLLHPSFAHAAARTAPRDGPVRRLLVSLGGVDAADATGRVLAALDAVDTGPIAIDVVVGRSQPNRAGVARWCESRTGAALHVDVDDMAAMLAEADLAIGAGGSSTWERCAVGVPTLALCIAGNQEKVIAAASRAGLLYAIDGAFPSPADLARHVHALIHSSGLRAHLSAAGRAAVDGRGAMRVAAMLTGGPALRLREAHEGDRDAMHRWRNDPSVRTVSRSDEAIAPEGHRRWFAAAMADDERDLLIAERDGEPAGVVRFDRADATAEISIYLVPGRQGRGEGTALLAASERWLKENRPGVRLVTATVRPENRASLALFRRCGYSERETHFVKGLRD